MGEQLHRRLPQALIEEILEAFSQHELSEAQACEMLGIKRARQSYRYTVTTAEARVQFRRVLRSLDIGIIYSTKGAPEARGKIEKRFDYFQRRLPFLCEKYRVRELAEGNRLLAEAVAYYHDERVHVETGEIPTRRWEEAIAAEQGRLRPLPGEADLREIFSLHLERTVGKDGTFPFLGQRWSLNRA